MGGNGARSSAGYLIEMDEGFLHPREIAGRDIDIANEFVDVFRDWRSLPAGMLGRVERIWAIGKKILEKNVGTNTLQTIESSPYQQYRARSHCQKSCRALETSNCVFQEDPG